ncbi:MAG: ExeA family protein [Planctomycetota bacterium]|jgi:type II secretory pathway predicted ATPase ExeA
MRKATLKAFGLATDPFTKEFNDQDAWLPDSKKKAVSAIVDALTAREHVALIGEPGAGKTVVLRAVRHALPETRFRLTYCHNATLGRRDFYRQLCGAIGLSCKASAAAIFDALNDYVGALATERGPHPVFLLDECHLMKDDMLDHLHILQNYAWDSKSLLSLVLIGLPELGERLHRRRHRSLMSRIQCRLRIEPLGPPDTGEYLMYRLGQAGCTQELFPPDAVALLHEKTSGLMRDIDRIAALSLNIAHRQRTKVVHKDILLDAINVDTHGEIL